MLIQRITTLQYHGENPTKDFVGKSPEKKLIDHMKNDSGLAKKLWGYAISYMSDEAMHFSAQMLT